MISRCRREAATGILRKEIGVMKKINLKKPKGFTLVEVVIAIAVFAIMTIMILMIMQSAVKTSKKASDDEYNLNGLVENVVRDDSAKRYGEYDSSEFKMAFAKGDTVSSGASENYTVTYSTVDGHKNYVVCPYCSHMENNIAFMASAVYNSVEYKAAITADPSIEQKYRLSYWFNPLTMNYVCPACEKTIDLGTDLEFICEGCENSGPIRSGGSLNFTFDSRTGNFECGKCSGGNVKQVGIDQKVSEDAALSVTGMSANSIRYSNLKEPTEKDKLAIISFAGRDSDNPLLEEEKNFIVEITYDNTNKSKNVVYKMKFSNFNLKSGEGAIDMTILFPGSYILEVKNQSTSIEDKIINYGSLNYMDSEQESSIKLSGLTRENVGSDFWIEFTLKNYVNSNPFEYDYAEEGGLLTYWFGCEPNGFKNIGTVTGSFLFSRKDSDVYTVEKFQK